jgi:hypothetical protein
MMTLDAGRDRRLLVARHPFLRGMDGATVLRRGSEVDVDLHFIPAAPGVDKASVPSGAELQAASVRLEGPAARRWSVRSLAAGTGDPQVVRAVLARASSAQPAGEEHIVVRLVGVRNLAAPFDAVTVRLGATDLVEPTHAPPSGPRTPSAAIDYLAKDFASFRQLMLDRIARTYPAWSERHIPDVGIVMVELLAYAADYLSYYQDVVATDAYLATARSRTAVRRHARTLGYRLHDGCAARVWLQFDVPAPLTIGPELAVSSRGEDPAVFRTLEALACRPEHDALTLYDFGEDAFTLPAGATAATLTVEGGDPTFVDGDVVIFEQHRDPSSGENVDVDPRLRQAVRLRGLPRVTTDPLTGARICEVAWDERDALAFPLVVAARADRSGIQHTGLARALGNIVAAEFGALAPVDEAELPVVAEGARAYRPRLLGRDLTFAVPYDARTARRRSARSLTELAPADALPVITLQQFPYADRSRPALVWHPVLDLLAARPDARVFVVETETDGSVSLRFGDGVHGRVPEPGSLFVASYRVGNGVRGHIGADVLTFTQGRTRSEIEILDDPRTSVRNPLPSAGGVDPEPLDQARRDVPGWLRVQERCVIDDDYVAAAKALPDVRNATVDRVFTGAWPTVRLFVQRAAGAEDAAFLAHARTALAPQLLINVDLAIVPPVFVPVDLELTVTLAANAEREAVLARVDAAVALALGAEDFTFAQHVYASPVIAAAMGVRGVLDAVVTRLARRGALPAGAAPAELPMRAHEIARIDRCTVVVRTAVG